MHSIQLIQLKKYLKKELDSYIDVSDAIKGQEEQSFYTRAFAFFALKTLSEVDADSISDCITDDFKDNGIDALFYQKEENTLWLVQSKWKNDASGSFSTGETLTFISGIKDILDFEEKKDRFNEKIKNKEDSIIGATDNFNIKFKCIMACTSNNLSKETIDLINDFVTEMNKDGDYFEICNFRLSDAHQAIKYEGRPINIDIDLTNWGLIEQPYQTYYGQVYAIDIANWWLEHKEKLSSKNIRGFKGDTVINQKIVMTLLNNSDDFFYLNNGITITCKSIKYKRIPPNRDHNGFICEDISVVNGAQTVGCIGEAFKIDPEKLKNVKVMVKLVSLDTAPENFGDLVTNATNTQNKVSNKDFASKDKIQIKLQKELSLEGINYYIKNYENIQKNENNFDLEDAAISLACQNNDIALANIAKGQVGKLFEDINKKPYIDLFNESTTYLQVKRVVKVMYLLDKEISPKRNRRTNKDLEPRAKMFYIHGNRFLLHMVFQTISKLILNGYDENEFEEFVEGQAFIKKINKIAELGIYHQENLYPNSALHQLYKNRVKCEDLKNHILNDLLK